MNPKKLFSSTPILCRSLPLMRQIILHIVHVKVRMKMELNKKVYAKPIFSGVPSKKSNTF